MTIERLKTVLKKVDAKIISSLSSEVKSKKLLTSGIKVNFSDARTKAALLELINIYDRDALSVVTRSESYKSSKILLPIYKKLKNVAKPRLKKGLHLIRNIKAKIS